MYITNIHITASILLFIKWNCMIDWCTIPHIFFPENVGLEKFYCEKILAIVKKFVW